MKETAGFPASYKLIKLYRKAVHEFKPDENFNGSQIMLAMDYFDALEVRSFKPDTDKFSEFMGLSINEDLTEYDVAMQSIPLYCPKLTGDMIEEYHCDNDCFEDPFEGDVSKFRYFGMIQVYITPEILARFDRSYFRDTLQDSSDSYYLNMYNAFFKDVHILMSEFVKSNFPEDKSGTFIYRVYQSMSVGDFVVAMRCMEPEVPFKVASMLRRRRYALTKSVKSHNGLECSNFVFYKTYTLMSLNTHIIQADPSDGSIIFDSNNEERKFILRCVLSNKYWSDEKDIIKKYPMEDYLGSESCLRLNGRYDFTVTLSEKAFLYLHPRLVMYKIGGNLDIADIANIPKPDKAEENNVCEFIIKLMDDKQISYVNERFVFKGTSTVEEAGHCNEDIHIIEPKNNFFFANEVIAGKLEELQNDVERAYQRTLKIDTSRTSIVYSMRLLKRFVGTCNSINGISDSRVYCSIIMQQVKVILSGVDYYLSYLGVDDLDEINDDGIKTSSNVPECTDAEYFDILDVLDKNLKEALEYMNLFAKFILDSSLQSLQTPHFNLETHISVEKLLLSYSYFVQCFFEWYGKTEMCKQINGMLTEYFTMMVPQPMDSSLSTITLFNWHKDESQRQRLLVMLCPSFSDMTDFSASVGVLLHEIAHSLRYENRADRNKIILRYGTDLLFLKVSESIIMDLRKNIPGIEKYDLFLESIVRCLSEAYEKYIGINYESSSDKSFSMLIDDIYTKYNEFVVAVGYLSRIKNLIQSLLIDYDRRLRDEYKPLVRSAFEFNNIFFGPEGREKRGPDDYLDAYLDLVCRLEELLFDSENHDEVYQYESTIDLYNNLVDFKYSDDTKDTKDFLALCANVVKFEYEANNNFRNTIMGFRKIVDGRKIARFLHVGTYASITGEERDFADYAESYIILCQPATKELYHSMIDIYREITSDLYMIKLLGLTPYGYLNFYTKNIPVDDIMTETYARRFCMVLYALENDINKGEKIDWDQVWVDMYNAICRHFIRFVKKYRSKEYEKIIDSRMSVVDMQGEITISEYLKMLGDKIESCLVEQNNVSDTEEYDREIITDNLRLIAAGVLAINESLQPGTESSIVIEQEKFVAELLHCRYLCSNCMSLIYEIQSQLQNIYCFDYLGKDFQSGCDNLNRLHDEFAKSGLWKYCSRISEAYNETDPNSTDLDESNRLMAEFVLDMNYGMLYSNAFKIIDNP